MPYSPTKTDGHEAHYDLLGNKVGMWVFLFTEALLFGILFITFFVYLHEYKFDFMNASHELNKLLGGLNTLILLTSSLTMALAIGAMQRDNKGLSLKLMGATLMFGFAFLVVKAFEWGMKFEHGIYPKSELMLTRPHGEQLFFGLYFTMTGLHAAHIIIGSVLILFAIRFVKTGKTTQKRISFLENAGLYWHLVDVVWIYLFPMFYLIGRK